MVDLFAPTGRWKNLPSIADRIDASGDCWVWAGKAQVRGYGNINLGNGKWMLVHRLVWEALVGPIPDDLECDHLCRNTLCCNPDHIELVTHAENMRRGQVTRHWTRRTHCKNGHPFSGSNLFQRSSGGRGCRACKKAAAGRYRKRKARENDSTHERP